MKILRGLYMLVESIVLLPVIVLTAVIFLACLFYAHKLLGEPVRNAFITWLRYLKTGIEMNLDFIENGL